MRIESKIAIAAVVLVGGYFGYQKWTAWQVTRIPTPSIAPGKFNLLGLKPNEEYSTRIATGTAFIVRGAGDEVFGSHGDQGAAGDKIPTADVLTAKGGDVDALGQLAVRMNSLSKGDPPSEAVLWTQADIEKALAGDALLRSKLEHALALPLKRGDPLPDITAKSLDNGILVRIDIPVTYDLPGGRRTVVAHADIPYRPEAVLHLQDELKDQFVGGAQEVAIFRRDASQSTEDIPASLRALYSPSRTRHYGEVVGNLLDLTFIILTERYITHASKDEDPPAPYRTSSTYNLHMDLTPEGRARLWKFSSVYGGRRVLVLMEGVSAEGSQLEQGLNVPSFDISRLEDQTGAEAVVKLVNGSRSQ